MVISTVAGILETIPSDTVKVKLSLHVYPSAGVYVNTHVEVIFKIPLTGKVAAVKLTTDSTSEPMRIHE